MKFSQIRRATIPVVFVFVFVESFLGAPTAKNPSLKAPKFLLKLFNKVKSGDDLGVAAVHAFLAVVKRPVVTGSPIELSANFSRFNSSSKVKRADLHLDIKAGTTIQTVASHAACKLVVGDIETGASILSRKIACQSSSEEIVPLTSFVKSWVKAPAKNRGVRVQISTNITAMPKRSLPFVEFSPSGDRPFFIVYEG